MIVRPRGHLWEHRCDNCNASWYGPEGDDCYWCDKRLELRRQSERQHLLFPEWMNWGDRFRDCSEIHRTIWATTRGFTGDYRGKWEYALFDALEKGTITDDDADAAYGRYERWMTHMQNSASV